MAQAFGGKHLLIGHPAGAQIDESSRFCDTPPMIRQAATPPTALNPDQGPERKNLDGWNPRDRRGASFG
jgi:hypothetical protein